MPVLTGLTSGTDPTDGTSFATASVSPTGNRLLLLAVLSSRGDSVDPAAPTASGNGLTWVQIASVQFDTGGTSRSRLTLFRAMGASPSSGVITISVTGTHSSCSWSLVQSDTDIDTSGTNGSGAIVQNATNVEEPDADQAITATLAAFADTDNATYGCFAINSANAWTVGSGFTSLHSVTQGTAPVAALLSEYKDANDTTVDATHGTSGLGMGVIAVEVRAAGTGVAVTTATETDSALALVKKKRKTLGIAPQTNAALAIVRLLPPANTLAPAVTGTVREGSTLTTTDGSWTGSPSFTYQWQRADNVGFTVGVTSVGSNQPTFVPTSAEVGKYVRCRVTGTNGAGSVQANSNVVGPVSAIPNFAALPPRVHIETEWELDPTATSGTEKWRRVTHLARDFRIRRGSGRSLERTQAGSLSIRLDNSDRRFETGYAGTVRNIHTNPSLETNANGYTNLGAADMSRAAGSPMFRGVAAYVIGNLGTTLAIGDGVRIVNADTSRIPVTAAALWSFSARVSEFVAAPSPVSVKLQVLEYNAAAALIRTTDSPAAIVGGYNEWGTHSISVVTLGTTATVALQVVVTTTGTENDEGVYVDGIQVELGELTAYIDGDDDNGRWEGTVHASRSFRGGPYYPNVRPMRRVRVIATHGNPVEDSSLETVPRTGADDPVLVDAWLQTEGSITRVTTTPFVDSYCYRGEKTDADGAIMVSASRYRIPVDPGNPVILSAYLRKPLGGANPESLIGIELYDASGGSIGNWGVGTINPPDNAWQRYETPVLIVPSTVAYIGIGIRVVNGDFGDSIPANGTVAFVDGIQIDFGELTDYVQGNGSRVLFRGFIQRFPQATTSYRRGEVTLGAVDAMAVLAAGEFTGSPPSEGSKARLDRVLDHIGWPTALRKLDTGAITLVAGTDLKTPHLTHCLDVAETEEGIFFVDGPGYAVLHDKNHRPTNVRSTVSQATFGDGGPSPNVAALLTVSGNEITDGVRAASSSGDGRPADSSFGIWEATTNLVRNGGTETNLDGYFGGYNATFAQTGEAFKFGTKALRVFQTDAGDFGVFVRDPADFITGIVVGTTYTASLWVRNANGNVPIMAQIHWYTSAGVYISSSNSAPITPAFLGGGFHRVFVTAVAPATAAKAQISPGSSGVSGTGNIFDVDGMQFEVQPLATPYVHTDGATAARTAARVQAPSSLIDETQGWVAMRIRPGWTTDVNEPGNNNYVGFMEWADDGNNYFQLLYSELGNTLQLFRYAAGAGSFASKPVTLTAGVPATIIAAWTATKVKVSFDGSAFTEASNTTIPTLTDTTIDIGSAQHFSNHILDGELLWAATGTGPLTDADAALLHGYSDGDLGGGAHPAAWGPTAFWAADTAAYEQTLVPELPFLPSILPDQDVQHVINEVKATRTGGAEQTAADSASDDHYFTRSRSYATLHSTDGAALTFAQNVLAKLKEPGLELERLEVEPARDPLLWPVALALEISDRITVNRRAQGLELKTYTLFVEAVEHQCRIDGERIQWVVGWYLSQV